MRNKSKLITIIIAGIIVVSLSCNFYQQNKISNYKEELSSKVRNEIHRLLLNLLQKLFQNLHNY